MVQVDVENAMACGDAHEDGRSSREIFALCHHIPESTEESGGKEITSPHLKAVYDSSPVHRVDAATAGAAGSTFGQAARQSPGVYLAHQAPSRPKWVSLSAHYQAYPPEADTLLTLPTYPRSSPLGGEIESDSFNSERVPRRGLSSRAEWAQGQGFIFLWPF